MNPSSPLLPLTLVTDAFGGHGGIAVYNRDFLTALSQHPDIQRMTVVPRLRHFSDIPVPDDIEHIEEALGGKSRYARATLRQLTRRPRHNLVLCNHINLLPLAKTCSTFLRAPLVLTIYGIDAWQPTPGRIANSLVRSVDAVISVSQTTLDRFLSWAHVDPGICHLLPNAIHTEDYGLGKKNPNLVDRYRLAGKKTILTFGRLVSRERSKGFDEILEILPGLLKEHPGIAYLIAGTGEDRDRLEKKAADLGVTEHVRFTGFVEEDEKADLYRLADLYAMPSRGEGFGFVFLEAMACGVPVVASKTDGSREAVRDGLLGALVDPDNLNEIHTTVSRALTQAQHGIPEGLDYFEFPNFTRRLHKIIDQVTAGKT